MPKKITEKTKSVNEKPQKLNKIELVYSQNPELKNAVSQIEKTFGEGAIMSLGLDRTPSLSGISTGSLSLDIA
jgi:recombination protein RecA